MTNFSVRVWTIFTKVHLFYYCTFRINHANRAALKTPVIITHPNCVRQLLQMHKINSATENDCKPSDLLVTTHRCVIVSNNDTFYELDARTKFVDLVW